MNITNVLLLNALLILQPASAIENRIHSVLEHGAVGDGKTDDTDAIIFSDVEQLKIDGLRMPIINQLPAWQPPRVAATAVSLTAFSAAHRRVTVALELSW